MAAETFLREFVRARAERVVELPFGFAVRSPRHFPHSHDHNAVHVEAPVDPAVLLAATDDVLADCGYRRVELASGADSADSADSADAAVAFAAAGYAREDDVVMTLRRPADPDRPEAGDVTVLDLADRIATAAAQWEVEAPDLPREVARELGGRARTALTAARCTFLAVTGSSGVEARCDLFVRDDTAQVEEVMTGEPFQGRGHASRLVRAAVVRARFDRPDREVFLVADVDDWPRELYTRLGFDVGATRTVWTRNGG